MKTALVFCLLLLSPVVAQEGGDDETPPPVPKSTDIATIVIDHASNINCVMPWADQGDTNCLTLNFNLTVEQGSEEEGITTYSCNVSVGPICANIKSQATLAGCIGTAIRGCLTSQGMSQDDANEVVTTTGTSVLIGCVGGSNPDFGTPNNPEEQTVPTNTSNKPIVRFWIE